MYASLFKKDISHISSNLMQTPQLQCYSRAGAADVNYRNPNPPHSRVHSAASKARHITPSCPQFVTTHCQNEGCCFFSLQVKVRSNQFWRATRKISMHPAPGLLRLTWACKFFLVKRQLMWYQTWFEILTNKLYQTFRPSCANHQTSLLTNWRSQCYPWFLFLAFMLRWRFTAQPRGFFSSN